MSAVPASGESCVQSKDPMERPAGPCTQARNQALLCFVMCSAGAPTELVLRLCALFCDLCRQSYTQKRIWLHSTGCDTILVSERRIGNWLEGTISDTGRLWLVGKKQPMRHGKWKQTEDFSAHVRLFCSFSRQSASHEPDDNTSERFARVAVNFLFDTNYFAQVTRKIAAAGWVSPSIHSASANTSCDKRHQPLTHTAHRRRWRQQCFRSSRTTLWRRLLNRFLGFPRDLLYWSLADHHHSVQSSLYGTCLKCA